VPVALITGITGQDGSYLADFLLSKSYQVVGMVRRSSTVTFERIQSIQDKIQIAPGDLHDHSSLVDILQEWIDFRSHQGTQKIGLVSQGQFRWPGADDGVCRPRKIVKNALR
jgi:nucleoside-diphosphate-sugar epimerase